jgi:hypothetical protein
MLDSPSSLSYSMILSIMQVLISVILQMQYSAHGWLLEIFLVFQLVRAGIGTSMPFYVLSFVIA